MKRKKTGMALVLITRFFSKAGTEGYAAGEFKANNMDFDWRIRLSVKV